MKHFYFIFSLIFIELLCFKAHCQNLPSSVNTTAPPSPGALSSVNGSGSYSVNYYAGKLTYTAPINNFKCSKISLPVSLSYSSSGIKVQDIDGSVGNTWKLNAGGVISRFVESLPDEAANGYCGSNQIGAKSYNSLTTNYFDNIINQTWDSEPDKFIFSFLGFSGVFELDQNGMPVLQSSYGLKIVYSPFNRTTGRLAGGNEDWIISDFQGNLYYFGDGATETSSVTQHGASKNTTQSFISSWYISKIVTVDGQVINFQYQSFPSYSYTNYVNAYEPPFSVSGECSTGSHPSATWNENTDITISTPIYLSKIISTSEELDFIYNANSPYITEIDAYQNGRFELKYQLNYIAINYSNFTRNLLSNIKQISILSGNSIVLFSFNYNTNQYLPLRNSLQTDYWGYYNSNAGSSDIEGYNGGDKTPDPIKTAANILTSVTNQYGGKVTFAYEQNDYGSNNSTIPTGGLRIKSITNYVNGMQSSNQTFSYIDSSTGYSSGQPYISTNNYSLSMDYWIYPGNTLCVVSDIIYYSESLTSLFDLNGVQTGYSCVTVTNADGSSKRYRFKNFSDYPDLENKKMFYNNSQNDGSSYEITPQFPQTSYAFARGKLISEEDIDNKTNVIKKISNLYSLSSAIGDIIAYKAYVQRWINGTAAYYYNSKADFSTQDLLLTSKTETNFFFTNGSLSGTSSTTENYTYTTYAGNNFLSSKTRTLSDGNTEKTTYRYPFNVLTTIPASATTSLPVSFLTINNIISQPIEVVTSVINATTNAEILMGVSLTRYAATPFGTVKPSSQYRLKISQSLAKSSYTGYSVTPGTNSETETIDPNLEAVQLFTSYDGMGNLTESNNPYTTNGQTGYLYGYGLNYLIAQAKNAKSTELFYNSFEESTQNVATSGAHTGKQYFNLTSYTVGWTPPDSKAYVISYWYLSSGTWKFSGVQNYTGTSMVLSAGTGYDDICIYPSDALITTYTYEPLVGITSTEDSKGQTTSYEYDEYKRLLNIKDKQGNIVKSYAYYIQGQ